MRVCVHNNTTAIRHQGVAEQQKFFEKTLIWTVLRSVIMTLVSSILIILKFKTNMSEFCRPMLTTSRFVSNFIISLRFSFCFYCSVCVILEHSNPNSPGQVCPVVCHTYPNMRQVADQIQANSAFMCLVQKDSSRIYQKDNRVKLKLPVILLQRNLLREATFFTFLITVMLKGLKLNRSNLLLGIKSSYVGLIFLQILKKLLLKVLKNVLQSFSRQPTRRKIE